MLRAKKELTYKLFEGKPKNYRSIGVDYDGTLNYFDTAHIRSTWASESYRGGNKLETIQNSEYLTNTSLVRESAKGLCPFNCCKWGECDRQDGSWGCGLHVYEERGFKPI